MEGTIVGSYCILDAISAGGMGTVYRAEHTLLGRLAAIKILHPELSGNRDIVGRFFNEAKTTTSIKHPGIVEVFDFGYMDSGHAYLIMELLEGEPLSRRMRERGPLPEGEAAMLLRGVCIALAAAHDKGIIHRDLKPDNIFVVPDPDSALGVRTKLLDFGIAKLTEIGLATRATKTGAVMGTPTYMSPEQCRGTGEIDFRADLYSIGCVFYELVTGRPPFVHTGAGELIGDHLLVEPEPPSKHAPELSPETDTLIMTLLAKQPDQRVQSAKELAIILGSIALQHGWISPADANRPTLSHPTLTPSQLGYRTPSGTPAPRLPSGLPATPPKLSLALTLTPVDALLGSAPTQSPPQTLVNDKPTTLSGAASQIQLPALARRWVRVAIGAGIFLSAGVIAAIVVLSGPVERRHRAAARPGVTAPAAAVSEPPVPPMPTTRPGAPTTIVAPHASPAHVASPATPPAVAPVASSPAATVPPIVVPGTAALTPPGARPVGKRPGSIATRPALPGARPALPGAKPTLPGTQPAQAVATPPAAVETKPAETKPAETKPAETKPAEAKPAETKPVPPKDPDLLEQDI